GGLDLLERRVDAEIEPVHAQQLDRRLERLERPAARRVQVDLDPAAERALEARVRVRQRRREQALDLFEVPAVELALGALARQRERELVLGRPAVGAEQLEAGAAVLGRGGERRGGARALRREPVQARKLEALALLLDRRAAP